MSPDFQHSAMLTINCGVVKIIFVTKTINRFRSNEKGRQQDLRVSRLSGKGFCLFSCIFWIEPLQLKYVGRARMSQGSGSSNTLDKNC